MIYEIECVLIDIEKVYYVSNIKTDFKPLSHLIFFEVIISGVKIEIVKAIHCDCRGIAHNFSEQKEDFERKYEEFKKLVIDSQKFKSPKLVSEDNTKALISQGFLLQFLSCFL